MDLFATKANMIFPLYVSPVLDPMAWKQDALQPPWNDLNAYAFPPFAFLRQVLYRVMFFLQISVVLVVSLWPHMEWLTVLLLGEPLELPLQWNLLVKPHIREFQRSGDNAMSCMEVVK